MTDAIAAPEAVPTPATAPVLTSQEIEALIERKAQEISDKRVSGLMSSYDKKFAALQRQLSGDAEPVEDPAIAALKRENAILKAAQRFPKAAPLYQKLLEVEDTEEQIALMEKWLTPPPEAAPVPPAPEPETPEPSTPSRSQQPSADAQRWRASHASRWSVHGPQVRLPVHRTGAGCMGDP